MTPLVADIARVLGIEMTPEQAVAVHDLVAAETANCARDLRDALRKWLWKAAREQRIRSRSKTEPQRSFFEAGAQVLAVAADALVNLQVTPRGAHETDNGEA